MSGARRAILADLHKGGKGHFTESELKNALSPASILAETGTSAEDVREGYVGNNAPAPISPADPNK